MSNHTCAATQRMSHGNVSSLLIRLLGCPLCYQSHPARGQVQVNSTNGPHSTAQNFHVCQALGILKSFQGWGKYDMTWIHC
jgi:hypothetical protein